MSELFTQLQQLAAALLDSLLLNSDHLMALLGRPEFLVATFVMLNLVVFTETGLLIGFCLPGDSLLVTAGLVFHNLIHVQGLSGWLLPLLLVTLCISAILGDSVGYSIGFRTGPRIFNREKSFLFRKEHLLAAQAFYEKHGGKTIVLARFMPFLRTFAPVVAGVGKMPYRRFLFFNIFGGIGWVCSMILFGFALTPILEKPLQALFGENFKIEKNVELLVVLVVLVSISPGIYAWARQKWRKRRAGTGAKSIV